jgi:hypothetical protein
MLARAVAEPRRAVTSAPPAPLPALLGVTFLASVSGGVFWASIFFVTAGHYAFSPLRNLVLAALMGAVYVVAAKGAGVLARRLPPWLTPRALLVAALGVWTVAPLLPIVFAGSEAALWAGALLGAGASAVTWPIVESYLTAGRHGARMRAAIGWFNVTWTPAVAVSLLVMPLVGRASPLGTLALSAAGSAAAMLAVAALPRRPGEHEAAASEAAVGPEYRYLARSSAWLLPLSYVLASALAPVLPHRLAEVGGGIPDGTVAALWMLTRFVVLVLMWRSGFWHGRWGTLGGAAAALVGGFALVLLASSLGMLAAGLFVFGAGMGLTYYSALYYSMAVGHAAVEAGGTFEALIGVGYFVGPMIGIAGQLVASGPAAHARALSATVGLAWAVAAVGGWAAYRPFAEARRERQSPAP